MSTFAGSHSGIVSISTPLQEAFAGDVHADTHGLLRSLAERVGRDLVSNAEALSTHGAFEPGDIGHRLSPSLYPAWRISCFARLFCCACAKIGDANLS